MLNVRRTVSIASYIQGIIRTLQTTEKTMPHCCRAKPVAKNGPLIEHFYCNRKTGIRRLRMFSVIKTVRPTTTYH